MKYTLMMATTAAALVLAGCGGGGSDSTTSTTPPQGAYAAAATAGDFATFNISGNTLSYNVDGVVFGQQSGTVTLQQVFGPVWKDAGTSGLYAFLSGNIGIAQVPAGGSSVARVVGLKQTAALNAPDFTGKTYNYISIPNPGNAGVSMEGWALTINTDGTFSATSTGNASLSGCWAIVNGDHLVAKDGPSDCSNITDSTADMRVVLKPGTSRGGIVVDYVDGSGFGIGVEQKPLAAADVVSGTYKSYWYDGNNNDGFSEVTINNSNYTWAACNTSGVCTPQTSGTLALNSLCDGTPIDGVACATDANTGEQYNVFIDPTDGYYISVGVPTNLTTSVEIGSNQ